MGAHSARSRSATQRGGTKASARHGRRVEPYAWLGAGAVTFGIGAALAGGAAVAHADADTAAVHSNGPSANGHSADAQRVSNLTPAKKPNASKKAATQPSSPKSDTLGTAHHLTAFVGPSTHESTQPEHTRLAVHSQTRRSVEAGGAKPDDTSTALAHHRATLTSVFTAPPHTAAASAHLPAPTSTDPVTSSLPKGLIVSSSPQTAISRVTEASATQTVGDPNYGKYATVSLGGTPTNVAISADGRRSYVLVDGRVEIVNTSDSPPVVTDTVAVGSAPSTIAANANGSRAYVTNSGSNNVSVIEKGLTFGGAPQVTTVAVGSDPTGVAVNSSGSRAFVSSSGSDTVSIIDFDTSPLPLSLSKPPKVTTIAVGASPTSIAVNSAGTIAYVTDSAGNAVSIIKYSGVTPKVTTVPISGEPRSVKTSDSGTKAVVYSDNGIVSVINVSGTAPTVTTVPGNHYSYPSGAGSPNSADGFIAISADGSKAFVTEHDSGRVTIIDTANPGQAPIFANFSDYPHSIIALRDGSLAFTVAHDALYVIDSKTGQAYPVAIPADNDSSLFQRVAVSASGDRVIAVDNSGSLTTFYYSSGDGISTNPIEANIHLWIDSLGTVFDDLKVGGLGSALHVSVIFDDLYHLHFGQALYDTAQFAGGLLENSKFYPFQAVGVFLDVTSQAAQSIFTTMPAAGLGQYIVSHPFGAAGGATSAVVGLVGNTVGHVVGVPQVTINALVDPAVKAINDGADTLDNILHGHFPWQ